MPLSIRALKGASLAFLLAALPALPGAAHAAPADFQAWLTAEIDRDMSFPIAEYRHGRSGVAVVRFEADGPGRPAIVELVESSGVGAFDRAALRTIAGLDLPADAPSGPHVAILHYGAPSTASSDAGEDIRIAAAVGRARLAMHGAGAGGIRTVD